MIERWVKTLHELDFSAEEIADATWLTLLRYRLSDQNMLDSGSGDDDSETDHSEDASDRADADDAEQDASREASESQESPSQKRPLPPPSQLPERRNPALFPKQTPAKSTVGSTAEQQRLFLKVASAPALRDPLTFIKALRPLIQPIATARSAGLDEIATAQKIADERVWLPVTRPQVEPWLDLALVVDESPSMLIWRHTVLELVRLFKHYGAFRDVRVWGLIAAEHLRDWPPTGQATPSLDAQSIFIRPEFGGVMTQRSLRRPEVLIDPNQRRLVLVVTDCVSSLWRQGKVFPALQVWAEVGPMAIVQMLPDWMWSRTVLRYAQAIQLRGLEPAMANQRLTVVRDVLSAPLDTSLLRDEIRSPIFTLEPEKAASWSQMVGGRGGTLTRGMAFNPKVQSLLSEMEQARQYHMPEDLLPTERLQRFKRDSTLMARRLAGLLAAAPVINLQIVRLIQATMAPKSQQVHVAEVLLGGLMSPVTLPSPEVNPDEVEYRFKDRQIRTLLLKGAPIDDTAEVLMKVSSYVNKHLGKASLNEFVAELRNWLESEASVDGDTVRPFAVVAAEVLRRRGPRYADFVRAVEARYPTEMRPVRESSQASTYRSFAELSRYEREGTDFRIRGVEGAVSAIAFTLTEATRRELRRALRSAFPTTHALQRMVTDVFRFDIDEAPETFGDSSNAIDRLIVYVEAQGRVGDLIQAAYERDLGNPTLRQLFNDWVAYQEQEFASPTFAIAAIHGGKIEPGTTEVAEALAADYHSFYTLEGLKAVNNAILQIPSHLFDEPRALELFGKVETVVSVHGCRGDESFIHLGGLDEGRQARMRQHLGATGFEVLAMAAEEQKGINPNNICNRGKSGQGIQLELSRGLRDRLLADSETLNRFVEALQRSLLPPIAPEDESLEANDVFSDVELALFEFNDAQLVDTAEGDASTSRFPPLLATEEFAIVTFETVPQTDPVEDDPLTVELLPPPEQKLHQSVEPSLELRRFEFKVAKIERDGTRWVVRQRRGVAYRYIERFQEAANPSFLGNIARRIGFRNDLELEMVSIPGGRFLMGSPENAPENESPQHEVSLEPFFMGRYPVTQAQWRAMAGLPLVNQSLKPNPSRFRGDRLPVEQVNWYDAVEFCDRLSNHTGRQYRLPTEAEWEYACRAGTTTAFHFGDMILTEVANYNGSSYANGPGGRSREKTTPVEQFNIANDFGLSDMHGNVWEWCQDHYQYNYEGAPGDGSAWLTDKERAGRIVRGGSWVVFPGFCRSACRNGLNPDGLDFDGLGFRVVCSSPRALP